MTIYGPSAEWQVYRAGLGKSDIRAIQLLQGGRRHSR